MTDAERTHICGLLRAAKRMMESAQESDSQSVVYDYLEVAQEFTRLAYDMVDVYDTRLLDPDES